MRTFLVLGLLGGVAGWLIASGHELAGGVLLAAGAALVVAAYVAASRPSAEAVDGTTEAAALAILGLGALAGLGELMVTGGAAAILVFALGQKTRVQAFVRRIGEPEMRAALQFAVMALVVLPVLPEGPIGPWGGVRPRALWGIVLLFSGIDFAGYLVQRAIGTSRGYVVAGLLGGLVSSTAVTLAYARRSRTEPALAADLGRGAVAACIVLLPRVLVVAAAFNPPLALPLLGRLGPVLVAGLVLLAIGWRRLAGAGAEAAPLEAGHGDTRSPLNLGAAIRMALAFQVALTALELVVARFGMPGLLGTAAALGLTDMDALTLSMARLGGWQATLSAAAAAIGVGIVSNTALKLGVATALGGAGFRRVAIPGLLILGLATGLGLALAAG